MFMLGLIIPVSAEPFFSESFKYDEPGKMLPKPWMHRQDKEGNDAGVTLHDQGLSFKGFDSSGLSATFPKQKHESRFKTQTQSLSNAKTFYFRGLVQPVVKTTGGWGNQPICIALSSTSNKWDDGIWVGITQDLKGEAGNKGGDYFAVATGARPTQGWGNKRVHIFKDYGLLQDQAVYAFVAKFEISNTDDGLLCTAYLNVYKSGSALPDDEPEKWQFKTEAQKFKYPHGNDNYTFDQVIIHRDNTSSSAIIDELVIGTNWSDVRVKKTGSINTTVKPDAAATADENLQKPSGKPAPEIKIKIEPINAGHTD